MMSDNRKRVFYIKVVLSGIFKSLYNLTANKKDRQLLEDVIIDMFSRVYYPINKNSIDRENVAITMISATVKKGLILIVQLELYIKDKEFRKEIEETLLGLQMKPDFIKSIKIMNVLEPID